ncbi:TPA: hypothetical protein N0F65_012476 [Lagenidium giganteum]|uniref:Uncharacterized protein n=1 Tax=Lagenidium giganteum TaxID=4803 RepID=A0AAV2YN44_9STRA|nr:TPA: hypothetical protein N0F65_012476 [Lagenidium giganteum]
MVIRELICRNNQQASLVAWYKEVTDKYGEVEPVRFPQKKNEDGVVKKTHTRLDYTFLPAYFTWDQQYQLYIAHEKHEDDAYGGGRGRGGRGGGRSGGRRRGRG